MSLLTVITQKKSILKTALFCLVVLSFFVASTGHALAQDGSTIDVSWGAFGNTPSFIGDCESDIADILCGFSIAIHWAILGLFYVIGNVFATILGTMTSLVIWAIGKLGVAITTHSAVSLGFSISLSVANTIFVIAIIMIAFATILRWHEYEAKKLLPKLIITALLVNFSLLAAGLMLDVSNVFTTHFLTRDGAVTSAKIGKALSPQMFNLPAAYGAKYTDKTAGLKAVRTRYNKDSTLEENKVNYRIRLGYEDMSQDDFTKFLNNTANDDTLWARMNATNQGAFNNDAEISISAVWEQFLDMLPKVIFSILATFVAMLSMVAMFIMALIRNIWVVILLIVMPIAWSMRVLPKFEQYWGKWWEKFLNWGVLFLPTVAFFLYIAVQTAESSRANLISATGSFARNSRETVAGVSQNWLDTQAIAGQPSLIEALVLMLIVIGIMIAGLKIAQSMGSSVAGAFANMASKGSKRLAGGLLKGSFQTAGAAIGTAVGAGEGVWKGKGFGGKLKGIFSGGWKGVNEGAGTPDVAIRAAAGGTAKALGIANRLPGLGSVTAPLANALSGFANSQKGIEDVQKRWSDLKGGAQKSAVLNTLRGLGTSTEKAAALAYLAANHKLDWLDSEKDKESILAATKSIKDLSPNIDAKRIAALKAAASHFPDLAPQITGESKNEAIKRTSSAEMRSHDADHVAHNIDGYTAAQLIANASASGKNEDILKSTLADLIGGSPAFTADANLAAEVKELREIKNKIGELKDVTARDKAQERKGELLLNISNRIDSMTDTEKALLTAVDKDRVAKWERLKRVVGSAEPAEHASHASHDQPGFGSALKEDLSIGKVSSGGGGDTHHHAA